MTFSDQLRYFITHAGMSQAALARDCGISPSSLSRFLNGGSGLSFDALERLATYLKLHLLPQRTVERFESIAAALQRGELAKSEQNR